jgi:hypothetical protein
MVHPERFAALFNLSHPGHFISWGVLQVSYGNAVVIVLMVVAFVAALLLPFPGHRDKGGR